MPETVAIAGRKVNKNVIYFAGAGALGLVGYAWWTKGTGEETVAPDLPEPVPEPTDEPGFDVTGGLSGVEPRTNAEWTDLAVGRLTTYGLDPAAVSAAIGNFLARRPLNKVDASLVRQAIAAAGYPPVNGPWFVLEEVTPAPQPPVVTPPKPPAPKPPAPKPGPIGAVRGVRAVGGRGFADLSWTPVSGARGYEIMRATGRGNDTGWLAVGNRTSYRAPTLVRQATTYAFYVRAHGAPGAYGAPGKSNNVTVYP